jgi:thioredoxin 1
MVEEQKESRSIFKDASGPGQPEGATAAACSCRAWWKVAAVVVLLAVVAGIIAAKTRRGPSPAQELAHSGVGPQAGSPTQPASKPGAQADPEMVLATVNGEPITLARLQDVLQTLPDQYRTTFERSKHDLLEQLITRELLLQEARREGLRPAGADDNPGQPAEGEREAIQDLLRRQTADVRVTEDDLRSYYEERKDEIPGGASFEAIRDRLRPIVQQEREEQAVESCIAGLRAAATITRNEAWVEGQKALAADNPLDSALATGRPVLADFGRGLCIPCKMMKPILDDLKKEYAGKAEILIIEIDEYPAVTQRVGIRAIPTQIFYDAEGKETYRHQGFMSREAIVKKLQEMGMK